MLDQYHMIRFHRTIAGQLTSDKLNRAAALTYHDLDRDNGFFLLTRLICISVSTLPTIVVVAVTRLGAESADLLFMMLCVWGAMM